MKLNSSVHITMLYQSHGYLNNLIITFIYYTLYFISLMKDNINSHFFFKSENALLIEVIVMNIYVLKYPYFWPT